MQDGGARYAIPTNNAHLDPAAIGSARDNRNDGVLWKDDVLDGLVRFSDDVPPLQLDHLKLRLEQGQIVRRERQQQGVAAAGRLGVADDGQMWRLRHGSPAGLGREYASLSAACGPDQSTSNKEYMELRARKINKQQTFLFVRFSKILRHYLSRTLL